MKRILFPLGAALLIPATAFAQSAPEPTYAEPATEETSNAQTSTMDSSGITQKTYVGGIYASESNVKLNTIYLDESKVTGLWSEQISNLQNAAIQRSNVNVNSIQLYSGEMNGSVINQATYVNGMDIQDSNVEINRVILN